METDNQNKYSFGFSLNTGPCISIFNKNLENTFLGDFFPIARENGFGIKYRNTKSKVIAEPFTGTTFLLIDRTHNGFKWDYYLRGGFKSI